MQRSIHLGLQTRHWLAINNYTCMTNLITDTEVRWQRIVCNSALWYSQPSLLTPVCEVVVSGADVVVGALLDKTKDGALKRRRSIVQKLVERSLGLHGIWAGWRLHTLVVARACKSSGYILLRQGGWIINKWGPYHPYTVILKEGGAFPRNWIVGVGVCNFDNVVTISTSSTFTCISSLSVSTRITIVVRVWTCTVQ